jgi:hypothetical protein
MNQIDMADNTVYSQTDSHYISGNLKVQAVSLPIFVKQTPTLVSAEIEEQAKRPSFKAPLLMRINRILQIILISLSAIAIVAYSLDVMMTHNLTVCQEKAHRISEQNCELSAKLLKSISFQGIQESVLGHSAKQSSLHVPEEVLVASELAPVQYRRFVPTKHHLPLMSGY